MLTATTRPQADGFGGVEDILGAADVHRLEVSQVLAGPTQQGGAVDGGVGAGGRPPDGIGIGDVAGDHLDPRAASGSVSARLPGQGPDMVAPLGQQFADVGAGKPGGARHQDRLAHAELWTGGSGRAASTWSAL